MGDATEPAHDREAKPNQRRGQAERKDASRDKQEELSEAGKQQVRKRRVEDGGPQGEPTETRSGGLSARSGGREGGPPCQGDPPSS